MVMKAAQKNCRRTYVLKNYKDALLCNMKLWNHGYNLVDTYWLLMVKNCDTKYNFTIL